MTPTILSGSVTQPLCWVSVSSTSSSLLNENAKNLMDSHHNFLSVGWSTQLSASQSALKMGKRFVSFNRQDIFKKGFCAASLSNAEQDSSLDSQPMAHNPHSPQPQPPQMPPPVYPSNTQQEPYYQYNYYTPMPQAPQTQAPSAHIPSQPHQSNVQQGQYYNHYASTTHGQAPPDPRMTSPSYPTNVHQEPYYQYNQYNQYEQYTSTPQAPQAPQAPRAPEAPGMSQPNYRYNQYAPNPPAPATTSAPQAPQPLQAPSQSYPASKQYNQYTPTPPAPAAPSAPQAPQPLQTPSQSYPSNSQQEPYYQYAPITPVRRRPYNLEAKMRMKAYRRQAMQQRLQAEYEEEQRNFQLDKSTLYQKGHPDTVLGVIREINPVGYFVTLPSGREGFLAASQLGCSGGMALLERLYKVGEEIPVRVIETHTGGRDRLYVRP